jgi:hypothetical protein
MTIQIFDCEQGTEEWLLARLGVPTASRYSTVLAKGVGGKGPSKTRLTYMRQLVGERVRRQPAAEYGFKSAHMERGNAWEQDVCDIYAFSHADGQAVTKQGFLKHLGHNTGCSVDRLVGNDGILSVKTALPEILIDIALADKFPTEHLPQSHGELWLTGRQWVDIAIYYPGMNLFVKRLHRNQDEMARIAAAVKQFNKELDEMEVQYRRSGGSPTPVREMFRESIAHGDEAWTA